MTKKALAIVLTLTALAGCGDRSTTKTVTVTATDTTPGAIEPASTISTPASAADMIRLVVRLQEREQYGRFFDVLHPSQQRLVSRGSFVECWGRSGAFELKSLKVIDEYPERVDLPGAPNTPATAVTWREVGTDERGQYTETYTRYLVRVPRGWRYVLGAEAAKSLRDLTCLWGGRLARSGSSPVGSKPALAAKPKRPGEILLRGSTSPKLFGPFTFGPGGYLFRFEQYDPNNPTRNFATESSSFLVSLESVPDEVTDPYQLLVNATQRTGSNQATVSGRLYVNVNGDYSYVLRFTPRR